MKWIILFILICFGIEDFLYKKIHILPLVMFVCSAFFYGNWRYGLWCSLMGIAPGIVAAALATIYPKLLGIGDAILAIAYGSIYGWRQTSIWLMYSFWMVAIIGICVKLIVRRRHIEIPFVPFMTVAHLGLCL